MSVLTVEVSQHWWQSWSVPTLRIALIQKASSLDPEENRLALSVVSSLVREAQPAADLLVFPEAFARDFGPPGSDISEFAETTDSDGAFMTALTEIVEEHPVTVVAGMFERSADPQRPYNTLVVVDDQGLKAKYRKIHLYDSFGYKESDRLLAGDIKPVLLEVNGLNVGLMTCYDLRFPELARELAGRGADVIVVPSAWVAGPAKVDHWRTLVKARAIENTVYVVAVGQPGPRYTGHSLVVSPMGDVLVEGGTEEQVLEATLEQSLVAEARAHNPSLANRRF